MWWNSMSAFQQAMFIIACAATLALILQIISMLIGGSNEADVSDMSGGGGLTDATEVSGGGGMLDADVSDMQGGGMLDADGNGGLSSVFDGGGSGSLDSSDPTDGGDAEVSGRSGAAAFGLRLLSLRSIVAFVAIGGWVGYTLCYALSWQYALIIAIVCGLCASCLVTWAMLAFEKMQDSGNLNPANAIGTIGTVYLTVPPSRGGKGKVNILIQERYAEYEAMTDSHDPIPTAAEIKVIGHIGSNVLLVEKHKKPAITIEKD